KLNEPACDLAAAAAIWSSVEETPIPGDWVFMGELALTGEVRRAPQIEIRLQEAVKLGFKHLVIPEATLAKSLKGIDAHIHKISRVSQLSKILA
ncbi:MAG: DNA repair protein RadA, partial [Proteobacteria bacterium]